ncbi:MAG: polyketide synthase dehydratase domain-containing protein [Deltaproteobacteria bacterium]|nr:polyketide synthase dehydratase domain-containing protein [Deltaproteobacteria bacterium]
MRVEHPLVIPADRERQAQLGLEPTAAGSECEASLRQDASRVFFSARMRSAELACPKVQERPPPPGRWLRMEPYEGLLPHGEHFRCALALRRFDAEGVELHLSELSGHLELAQGKSSRSMLTRPTLLDGMLQVCSLHALRTRGTWGLPQSAQRVLLVAGGLGRSDALDCRICLVEEGRYDVLACSEDGSPVVEIGGLSLAEAADRDDCELARQRLERLLQGALAP